MINKDIKLLIKYFPQSTNLGEFTDEFYQT